MTIDRDAEEWLYAMLDTLAEAEAIDYGRRAIVALIEEYIDWFVRQSPYHADTARNAALRAITASGGLVVFTSPDDDERHLTSAHHLQQMLQLPTVEEALDATDAILVY